LETFAQIHTLFPERQALINSLLETDSDFHEMCEDYLEVDALLAGAGKDPEASESFLDYCRTLLEELEEEITETLQRKSSDL
jgi:hypothetical protein